MDEGQSGVEPRRWNPRVNPLTMAMRMSRGVDGLIRGTRRSQAEEGVPGSAATDSAHSARATGADGCEEKAGSASRDSTRAGLSEDWVAARIDRRIHGSAMSCFNKREKAVRVGSPPTAASASAARKRIRAEGWESWARTTGTREARSG